MAAGAIGERAVPRTDPPRWHPAATWCWLVGKPHRRDAALAAVVYLVLSVTLVGLTTLAHPTTRFIGSSSDPFAHVWFLAWWPHALFEGINPFHTHAVWAPAGVNLALTTSDPLPALVLIPITATLGPLATFNILTILAPALSAWTAYLLCRHVTGSSWPSLLGGYVFGFSSYQLARLHAGEPNLELTFLVPVCVLLVIRFVQGSLTPRRFIVYLAIVLFCQFLISPELLATLVAFGAMTLLAAALILPKETRPRLARAGLLSGAAFGVAAVTLAPYLYFAFTSPAPVKAVFVQRYSADLLSFVLPAPVTRFGHQAAAPLTVGMISPGGDQYLGIPLLAVIVLFGWRFRRSRGAWLLLATFGMVTLASLGPVLHIRGARSIPLPYALVQRLPLIRYALPARFVLYDFLLVSLLLAMWLAAPAAAGGRWGVAGRWGLAGLVVLSLLPNSSFSPARALYTPAFFATGTYRQVLWRDENVLVIPTPWNSPAMVWQAETGYYFRMPNGYVSTAVPQNDTPPPLLWTMVWGRLFVGARERVAPYLRARDIQAVMVVGGQGGPWDLLFGSLDPTPTRVQDVVIYEVPPGILAGPARG